MQPGRGNGSEWGGRRGGGARNSSRGHGNNYRQQRASPTTPSPFSEKKARGGRSRAKRVYQDYISQEVRPSFSYSCMFAQRKTSTKGVVSYAYFMHDRFCRSGCTEGIAGRYPVQRQNQDKRAQPEHSLRDCRRRSATVGHIPRH